MSFTIGDRIKVVQDVSGGPAGLVGRTGVIVEILPEPNEQTGCYPGVCYVDDTDGAAYVAIEAELALL